MDPAELCALERLCHHTKMFSVEPGGGKSLTQSKCWQMVWGAKTPRGGSWHTCCIFIQRAPLAAQLCTSPVDSRGPECSACDKPPDAGRGQLLESFVPFLVCLLGDLCEEGDDPCLPGFDLCQHDSKCVPLSKGYRWVCELLWSELHMKDNMTHLIAEFVMKNLPWCCTEDSTNQWSQWAKRDLLYRQPTTIN